MNSGITKTTTTAYQVGNDLIVAARGIEFCVKTTDGMMIYTNSEMQEIYGISEDALDNIKAVLTK